VTSNDATLGVPSIVHLLCRRFLVGGVRIVAMRDLGEFAVLYDEPWFVPGEPFGLSEYVGPCVGYGWLHIMGRW
jgi:hypothetical protein